MTALRQFWLFFILLSFFWGCGKSEKDLFEEAEKKQREEKIKESVEAYYSTLEKYPNGKYAVKALFELGKIYQSNLAIGIDREESLNNAIEKYKQIFDKYPESEEAPKALFMIGFIKSNELGLYEEAERIYKLFSEKYPNHELFISAQIELKNLGKSPEEILKSGKGE